MDDDPCRAILFLEGRRGDGSILAPFVMGPDRSPELLRNAAAVAQSASEAPAVDVLAAPRRSVAQAMAQTTTPASASPAPTNPVEPKP